MARAYFIFEFFSYSFSFSERLICKQGTAKHWILCHSLLPGKADGLREVDIRFQQQDPAEAYAGSIPRMLSAGHVWTLPTPSVRHGHTRNLVQRRPTLAGSHERHTQLNLTTSIWLFHSVVGCFISKALGHEILKGHVYDHV